MFNDLQIQAKKRLEEIFNRLTGVTPTRTGIIEFSISEVLNTQEKLIESVAGCSKKGLPYVYTLSISEDNQLDAIRESFSKAKAQEKNGRAYARLNKKPSYCFYVGSSFDFSKRYKEHIGYGAKATYALHLAHWAQDFPSLQLTLAYAEYQQGTEQDLLQALEDALWEKLQPMFGRQGSK
jgi:hypothetical protein